VSPTPPTIDLKTSAEELRRYAGMIEKTDRARAERLREIADRLEVLATMLPWRHA
jgi:hypothetical protein